MILYHGFHSENTCLSLILHQQGDSNLFETKVVDAKPQEDHSNQTQALNTDSLKVDLVVKQNSCSEKEDSNSETASSKSAKECSWKLKQDVHAFKIQDFTLYFDSQMTDTSLLNTLESRWFNTSKNTLLQHLYGNVRSPLMKKRSSQTVEKKGEALGQTSQLQDDNKQISSVAKFRKENVNFETGITKICLLITIKIKSGSKIEKRQLLLLANNADFKARIQEKVDSTGKVDSTFAQARLSVIPHLVQCNYPLYSMCKQTLGCQVQSMVAEKADITETIVKVDSQMMIQKNGRLITKFKPRTSRLKLRLSIKRSSSLTLTMSTEVNQADVGDSKQRSK
ncbi:hypothetical protein Tco_0549593 [Tanacetum coccineum]